VHSPNEERKNSQVFEGSEAAQHLARDARQLVVAEVSATNLSY